MKKKRKIKKGNLLFLGGWVLLFIAIVIAVVTFLMGRNKTAELDKQVQQAHNYTAYQEVVVSDTDIDSSYNDKLVDGIKNWALASVAIDSSYSEDSKTKLLRKLYDSIEQDDQRTALKESETNFLNQGASKTNNVDVVINDAKEATLNDKTMGQVTCTITVTGTMNDAEFTRVFDTTLLLSYDSDVVGVYVMKDIRVKE